jgi:integrase/recombinase XerD
MSIQPKSVVTVFVRHKESCSFQSRGEFYRGCQCSKFLRYSRNGKQHRQAAKTRTWSVAEDKAVELQEQLDRGDTPKPIIVKGPQPTIAECIDTFISAKESENISARRVKKLRLQLDQFEQFMSARSKLFPSLITAADVIEFRAGWDKVWESTTTRQKAQQNIRGFLRTCCRENLNDLLAARKTIKWAKEDKERLEPKPFTEKEIKTLFAQIPKTFPAEKIALATLLVKFMIATGVAIRDTVQLKRRSIQDGWLRINRQKTGRPVRQHLDPALCRELLAGEGEYIFWDGKYQVTSEVTTWQDDLRLLMQEAHLWIEGNVSHRFRDTAVDFWLGQGCSLTEVAAMLGDTLAVTERHYANLASVRMEERLKHVPKRSWTGEGAQA